MSDALPLPDEPAQAPEESPDRRVWRNTAGLVGGNVAGELLSLVVHAQVVHILGPANFGRFSQAYAVAEVADGVAAFGMNQVGPVLGVAYRDRLGDFLGTLLLFRATLTLLVMAGVVMLAPLLQSTSPETIRLAALTLLPIPLSGMATVPFFIGQDNWRISWLPSVTALVNSGLLILVLVLAPTVQWVIIAYLGTRIFHALVLSELARRRYRFRYGLDWSICRHLLRVGAKAGWLDMVVILYSKASYFVLDRMGPVMLGLYAIADKIAAPFLRITGALSAASLPMFAELGARGDWSDVRGFYLRTIRRVAVTLVLIAAVIYGVVPPILRHYFEPYIGALPVLYVLFVGVCFMSINQISSSCLNGLGHFGWIAVVATMNLGVYGIGVWLWVAEHKALGAARATTFMEGVNMVTQLALLVYTMRRRARLHRKDGSEAR